MSDLNDVRLVVNGKDFSGWQGVTITQSVDDLADGFSISAPWNPDNKDARAAFAPFGNQDCKLYIGDRLVITGILEKPAKSLSATDRTLSAEGRSKPGKLVDCYLDGKEYRDGMTLGAIFSDICQKFGVGVVMKGVAQDVVVYDSQPEDNGDDPGDYEDTQGDGTVKTNGVGPKPGEKAIDFLTRLAQAYGYTLSSDRYGRLIIGQPKAIGGLLGRLCEGPATEPGEIAILSGSADWDATQRFRGYYVFWAGQDSNQPGSVGKLGQPGTAYGPGYAADFGAGTDRYWYKSDDTIQTYIQADMVARVARSRAMAEASNVNVTVSGWRAPWGGLWSKSRLVHVYAPSIDIRREVSAIIAGVTMRVDDTSGLVTDLRLAPPLTYSGPGDANFDPNAWGFR